MYDIIIGRSEKDRKKIGTKGAIYLGKHYVKMGQVTSLSNKVYLDVTTSHVVFICGKRGGGKCLTADTLITMSDGRIVPIKDLETIDGEILSLNNSLKIQPSEKEGFYKRTVSKVLNIKLATGKCISLTPEHPLLTVLGWKEAKDLTNGSRIATPRVQPSFGENNLPEHTVKILAYILAEGHVSNGFVLFSNSDPAILSDFEHAINQFDSKLKVKKHGPYNYRVIDPTRKRAIKEDKRNPDGTFSKGVVFNSKNSLRILLEELFMYGKLATEREMPKEIFTLPKSKLALFLNRLFSCDGTIYKHGNSWRVGYCSASRTFIISVQHLLTRFGIVSVLREKNVNGFTSYELTSSGEHAWQYIQSIGFFGKKNKRASIALKETPKHNPNKDTIPKEIWNHYEPSNWNEIGSALGYSTPSAARQSTKYAPSRQKLLTIAESDKNLKMKLLAQSDIYWDSIVEIKEEHGSFDVYDITVPGDHNFVANDIIVHNSYTMGAIAEGFSMLEPDIKENLSVILLDTMGVYWPSKYPNYADELLLKEWGLEAKGIDIKIFTPYKYFDEYKKKGIPTDVPFSLDPSEIDPDDWCHAFRVDKFGKEGVAIFNAIHALREVGEKYTLHEIVAHIEEDKETSEEVRLTVKAMFKMADGWGVFSDNPTPLAELAKGGQISVLDVSCYATMPGGWDVKSLVVGVVSQRLFIDRMTYRKGEEQKQLNVALDYFSKKESTGKQEMPLVWLVIDEAHEFLPKNEKDVNAATMPLVEIMREGRQPGISLILATQQPGKIHTDVMTQSDTVLSHRITARMDVEALGMLTQSYMKEGLVRAIDDLPRVKGSAVLFDDTNERLYAIKVRPRISWHGGSAPSAIPKQKEKFSF